ncbi:MAG: hypothetical protein KDA41_15280, partial [Planctomycetales bacterium]|nr:hypothetical protein [Planctomycetales bacterium]
GNLRDGDWASPVIAGEPDVSHIFAASPGEIAAAVAAAIESGVDTIVVNGGDGSADLVFAALLKAGAAIPVAILPGGKTNMTADSWSIAGDKREALRRVLSARQRRDWNESKIPRTILRVSHGAGEPLYGTFFGAADVVDGILFCREHVYPLKMPNTISHGAAIALMFWRALLGFSAKHLEAAVHLTREKHTAEEGRFFFVGVTTLDQMLLGLAPAPVNDGGPLTYMSLRPGPRALLAALPEITARSVGGGYRRTVLKSERVTLRFDGAFTLDGELYDARKDHPVIIDAGGTLPIVRIAPS